MFYPWPFTIPNLFSFMSPTTFMSISAPGWNYAPTTEWGEGDLITETKVSKELATPERQLGIIGDALVALIDYLQHPEIEMSPEAERDIGRLITLVGDVRKIVAQEKARKGPVRLAEILPTSVRFPVHPALTKQDGPEKLQETLT